MENKAAQNIQDTFLNTARKERSNLTIYLLSGVKLTGRIRSFDKYSVVLETNNQEQLIFKHAISTVTMGRSSHGHTERAASAAIAPAHGDSASAPAPTPANNEG
jgi:host factor-I protein